MNQGLAAARGTYVAFCNNDTTVPPGWATHLVQSDHAAIRTRRSSFLP